MEGGEGDNGTKLDISLDDGSSERIENSDGPLMVAMQPGVDVPAAVEVVVVTAEDAQQLMQGGEVQTVVDSLTGQVVTVAACEEVQVAEAAEEVVGSVEPELQMRFNDNKGVVAQPRIQAPSDSSDDLDSSSSEEEEPPKPRRVPKKREFSYRIQWKNQDMINAMKAVTEKKITIRGAAKKYNVPYSTLKDRVHGRVQHGTKPGVKTVLSPEEEDDLVRYVKDMEGAGFELRCLDVRDRAGEILQLNHGHNTPYKDHSPGHNWFSGFVKRHQGMEFKKATNRNIVPSLNKQKNLCKKFFDTASYLYKKYKFHNRPERIFAVREVPLGGTLDASILVCASADGTVLPPFITFKGQRVKLTSARSVYPEAFFTCSYTGRVTDLVMLWWFRDHFLKRITGTSHRPVVLLVDRPVSDITFQLVQLAREERVNLVCMPNGISHLLQPLDDIFASWLEGCIGRKAKKWGEENPLQPFTQKILAQLLQKIWRKHMVPEEIREKFQERGLFPLAPGMITTDRIATAAQLLKETRQLSPVDGVSQYSNGDDEDSPFAGLSLLSALSSHEYATLDNARHQSSSGNVSTPDDIATESPPAKRRRRANPRYSTSAVTSASHAEEEDNNVEIDYETTVPEDDHSGVSHEIVQYGGSVPTDAELQVIHQVMKEATEIAKKEEEQQQQQPTLAEQLVAAKNDPDRISQAVESIGGNVEAVVTTTPTAPASTIIDTPLAGETVASRLSRRLLGTPVVAAPSRRSPRKPQAVVTEQIEQNIVTEQVAFPESIQQEPVVQIVEGQEIVLQDMNQLQEIEVMHDSGQQVIMQEDISQQVVEGAEILTQEQAEQLLTMEHAQQHEFIEQVQEEVVSTSPEQDSQALDRTSYRQLSSSVKTPKDDLTVNAPEKQLTTAQEEVQNSGDDGSQMVMTSSGEIMTIDQFNTLTAVANTTTQEEEVSQEIPIESQLQQEVVSSEPQQNYVTSTGEQIVYNNEQELMTSLDVAQQQIIEQPQYVTSVQELPIEQQVQNLIAQENTALLQQAPKVRQIKIVRPKIQVLPGSREVKLLPSRQPTKIIRIVRQKPRQPQLDAQRSPQIITLPAELLSNAANQPIVLQQNASGQLISVQEPQQEVVQEVVLQ